MTKSQYLSMRNKFSLDAQLLYTYATGKGMTLNFNEFFIGLPYWSSAVIKHLDREFSVTKLYDKSDNFIKIVD